MWKTVKLGDVCDLSTGGTPSRTKPEYFDNGDVKWLVSGDINQREIFDCDGRITQDGLKNSNAKFLSLNSVLIALNGQGKTRGTVALLRTNATCNQSLVAISPKEENSLDTKYIFYVLDGMYYKIRKITGDSGNDRRGLNMPLIRNIEFSYPPLAEQQRIVAKLDAAFAEIDTAIEVAEAKEVEVEKLKSSLLGGLLNNTENNFNTVKLGDVCDLVGGGTPSKNNDSYYDGNIPWATVRDMAFNELYVTQHKITELGLKNSSSKVIPKNNIIIACRVGLGKVCILQQDTAINQDLRGVIPKRENEIDKYFLFYWFKGIANQIISAGRGATVQGVKLPFLNSLSLPQPPLAEQQRIVAKLDKAFADLESGTLATLKSKANYQALKSAILAQELQSEAA